MKTTRLIITAIIGFCFALTALPAVFADSASAARLSSDEPVSDAPVASPDGSASQLPPMDFAPVDSTAAEPAANKEMSSTPKSSRKIREYWLKIHADEMAGIAKREEMPVEPGVNVAPAPVEPVVSVSETKPVEEKAAVAPAPAAVETNNLGIEKPIPHSEAPVVVQGAAREHKDVVVSKDDIAPPADGQAMEQASDLPLFSAALAKMTARRAQREADAKRLNIILPSQGGAADKVPASLKKLNATVSELIERRGTKFSFDTVAESGALAGTPAPAENK